MSKLSQDQLKRTFTAESISKLLSKLEPSGKKIIGQERAIKALSFGLGIEAKGFNVFVSGPHGTGKLTTVKEFLHDLARNNEIPDDWCYVNNFRDPYTPAKMRLKAGKGKIFKNDMEILLRDVQKALIKAFESEEYLNGQKEIKERVAAKQHHLFETKNEEFKEEGFILQQTSFGFMASPMVEGRPITEEEFKELKHERQEEIKNKQNVLTEELKDIVRQMRIFEKEGNKDLEDLNEKFTGFSVNPLIEEMMEKYEGMEEVLRFLEDVEQDILENVRYFLMPRQQQAENGANMVPIEEQIFSRYEVNLLVDNSKLEGVPVIIENNPVYPNVFGRIEKESKMGVLISDYRLIKKGSMHSANGGFLVIPVISLLKNPYTYDSLKRALVQGEILMEDLADQLGFISIKTLRPEPIPLEIKVILIGSPIYYHLLFDNDEEFREIFKVKADFDDVMEDSEQNIRDYLDMITECCRKDQLSPLDESGMARILEFSCRLSGDREKLCARFGTIIDVLKEACYYSRMEKAEKSTHEFVSKAIEEKLYRSNLYHEKIRELISKNIISINVDGEKKGQINGLSVFQLGDIHFGKPSRISTSLSIGGDGIIDIEREVKLGGKIHSKGVMIITGFLAGKFGRNKPVSLSARLVFEQSYSEIDGDSASSAELYALLSNLAGVPINQGIAVTGSVNQQGEIQAIGGVNEKVEGFFEVCSHAGLTGNQGVIIPYENVRSLMLRDNVVKAVGEGKFNIWAVKTIDEGIEILTGIPAGEIQEDGNYQKDSVYEKVEKNLEGFTDKMKEFMMKKES